MTDTMTAYVTGAGLGIVRRQLPVPSAGPGQLLVRTRAAAFNNSDLEPTGDEHVAGYEFSGIVVAVGEGVDASVVGNQVAGSTPGAFAPFVTVHHRHIITIPDTVTFEEAAALPTALFTEHGALTASGFTPGDAVLVTAATSAIGLIGVQIAKELGAGTVIATTRSADKRRALDHAGADVVIDTTAEDLNEAVLAATAGEGVQVVLDHIGGDSITPLLPATRAGGSIVSVGRLGGTTAPIDLFALASRRASIRAVSYGFTPPEVIGDLIDALAPTILPAVAARRIQAVIDSVFAFDDIDAALARLRSGATAGKVILMMPTDV